MTPQVTEYTRYDDAFKCILHVNNQHIFQVYDIANVDNHAWLIISKPFYTPEGAMAEFTKPTPIGGWVMQEGI